MRKVLKFVRGRRDDKKEHGSSFRSIGPFSDLPSPVDQTTPTDEHFAGLEHGFGYDVDLSGKDKSVTKLHKAAWQGNLEKLKVNMKKIDIDVVDSLNRTPLHLAAAQGHANVVWFLLGNKANMNICDKEGKTPFLKAIECGHKETIQIMLEKGVDINTIDYTGNSGLHIAAKQGFYEIASMLLKQGANFESSNNFGEFPLHIATIAEHKDLVELLLRYGSSVNIVDRDNRSPLMFAAKLGSMTLVQLFLEYGAQRAVMDSNDWTAEDYALMGGHQDIAVELKIPSERMAVSFIGKTLEAQTHDIGITATKRSISDASLPADQQEYEKQEKTSTDKVNEEADNSDTWNDSQISDSSLKQKGTGLKLMKFLPPSSDDEISEESIHSPRVQEMKEEEIQDSPRSCVIPPPCKPPRSWDLIQSGVIDDPKVLEPRRRSLLPLGSLRSRRESFNESPSATESPSFHENSPHIGQGDAEQWLGNQNFRKSDDKRDSLTNRHLNLSENEGSKDSPSTKYEDIQVKSVHGQEDSSRLLKEKKESSKVAGAGGDGMLNADVKSSKESLKGSSSDSEWDSDESLPLDNYPPVANVTISPAGDGDSPLKVFRVVNPSELQVPDNINNSKDGSPYSLNSEKRGRFLMRAPSIDLTDDDTETGKHKHSHSPVTSEMKHTLETKEESEVDRNQSAASTLGRDETLLGYEEVWESNAHIQASNFSGPLSNLGNTQISIKEELEEALVWSSPQFEGNGRVPPRPKCEKQISEKWSTNEDNLLYPSPRFDQKTKNLAVSETDVCPEAVKTCTSEDELHRKHNGLKLESRSLDALETQKFIPDIKIPRSRKHSRQQSISVQSWSKSEELQEKPPSGTQFDKMIEENKRINAQLRCYDEALRDLAHVSVVRKQSSLSLPRAKETSGLARSQSAGSRNEGYFSLPSANDFAPREMAQSAIVRKQGSLSLPRTSEIPDFAVGQSLVPKKQGHSSLPSTNEFGIREMAQTAIVKRQGSLSLPRTCEIPDLASAANEEYLSLPRSNELIDEAFKEIGQSSVTMKRGSRSLPRSIDAKSISLGADPVPPPRHKKSSRSRRRAESEGETSGSSLRDSVSSRSLSLDAKMQAPKRADSNISSLKSPSRKESSTQQTPDLGETSSAETISNTSSNNNIKEVSLEKPIRKKRKMLLAMRGFLGPNIKNINGANEVPIVNEVSVEESFDEPPFWLSTDKDGPLERQATVIERPNFSSKNKSVSPSRLETVDSEEKEESQQHSEVKEASEVVAVQLPVPLHEDVPVHEETASACSEKETYEQLLLDSVQKDSPEIQRDSQSDDAESGLSHSDNTPQHVYMLKGHHNLLKQHLQKATAEKGRLEETAAELGERAEKLKYELAEAREATRSRDEIIALLEDQLSRLEEMYTKSLEESQRYKLRLGNLEQELKHLKDVCNKYEEEKSQLTEIIRLKEAEIIINPDKQVVTKCEEQRSTGETETYEKHQELEVHMNYFEMEKKRLNEEIIKLEAKNEDLRQKLDAVVARNQLLNEDKAAICAKNSLDMKMLQEHSERWKQLYETCMKKLQLLSSTKQSVDNEAQTVNEIIIAERENFKVEVQEIINGIEEAKQKDYVIWHNKIQEDVLNAVQLLNAEYSRIDSSLLKHNDKLELLIQKLLEDIKSSPAKQVSQDGNVGESGTARGASRLVEELMLLNTELKDQYEKLRKQLQNRQEELRKKSETLKPILETDLGETSQTEEELKKENVFLKNQIMHLLNEYPKNSRELWCELKNENIKLKEKIDVLVEHIKDQEGKPKEIVMVEIMQEDNGKLETVTQQCAQVEECTGMAGNHTDTALTMYSGLLKTHIQKEESDLNDVESKLKHKTNKTLHDQETMTESVIEEQSSLLAAKDLSHELKKENMRLKKRIDLLVEYIEEKEDVVDVGTMTETDSSIYLNSESVHMENIELKKQINMLLRKAFHEQETMTEPIIWEPPEHYTDILNKFKMENIKLREKINLLEEHVKKNEAVMDRGVVTDPIEMEVNMYKEENIKLKEDLLMLQNEVVEQKYRVKNEGTAFCSNEGAEASSNVSKCHAPVLLNDPLEDGQYSYKCWNPLASAGDSENNRLTQFYVDDEQEIFEDVERHKSTILTENQKLQEFLDRNATVKEIEAIRKLIVKNKELKKELDVVRHKLREFHTFSPSDKTETHNVQTMTDPDIGLVHISMENAALKSQLQELSKDYEKKKEELGRTLVLVEESREASRMLLKEARDSTLQESTKLKQELGDVKEKLKTQEQEILKNRISTSKTNQSVKVTELCNLLDHLRKENTELQAQLKKMLSEKEDKEEVDIQYLNLQQNQAITEDIYPHEMLLADKNLDSLALLLSKNCPVPIDEPQKIENFVTKANDTEIMNVSVQTQNFSALHHNTNQQLQASLTSTNSSKNKQEFQNTDFMKSHLGMYSVLKPSKQKCNAEMGSKDDTLHCCSSKPSSQKPSLYSNGHKFEQVECKDISSEPSKEPVEEIYPTKQSFASTQMPGTTVKYKQPYKNNSTVSSSSEIFLEVKCCQTEVPWGQTSESENTELGNTSHESACRTSFRPCRDAATNTTPSAQNLELQRELLVEKDRCRKYQQNIKKLKSDVQLLKNRIGENRKPGKTDSNLALKQNNTNTSLLTGVQSPSHYDQTMAEFQRQVTELEQKVREENSMRFTLEVQVNKMRYELQEKLQLEKELSMLHNRLEKDFVSRYELEQLRNSYEVALSRAKYEAEMAARDDLNEKLCQINSFIEKQVQEQTRLGQLRNTTEAQMKQDFQETRLKLLSELAKVQASLQAKGEEEKELREKCEKLTRECEKKHEIRRKKLIEKSYNVNLAPNSSLKEKELNSKSYMLDMRSPLHRGSGTQPVINPISSSAVSPNTSDPWPTEHPFSHILRRELERSIRKHTRTESLSEHPSSSSTQTASEEHLELLKKKYFLH